MTRTGNTSIITKMTTTIMMRLSRKWKIWRGCQEEEEGNEVDSELGTSAHVSSARRNMEATGNVMD